MSGWKAILAALTLAAVVVADEPTDVDAEIVKNLDFYQYLDVLETQKMYELFEKDGTQNPEGHREERTSNQRGGESQ